MNQRYKVNVCRKYTTLLGCFDFSSLIFQNLHLWRNGKHLASRKPEEIAIHSPYDQPTKINLRKEATVTGERLNSLAKWAIATVNPICQRFTRLSLLGGFLEPDLGISPKFSVVIAMDDSTTDTAQFASWRSLISF